MTTLIIATKNDIDACQSVSETIQDGLDSLTDFYSDLAVRTTMLETHVPSVVQDALDLKANSSSVSSSLAAINTSLSVKLEASALTGLASETYVNSHIASIIGTAPANLDTLQEIAVQLATDESAVSALVTTVAGKANAVHTHAISDVTGLSASLAAKADASSVATSLAGKTDTSTTAALATRVTTAEGNITTNTSNISSLTTRMTSAETAATSLTGRVVSLEAWRAAKATASADVSTSYSVPTAVITLGLNCPTAAGINSIVGTIMGEVNGIKAILRSREILAA